MDNEMLLARRRILLAKQSRKEPDMVLLINSPNTGDFSVTTNYGTFMAAKVSEYPYFDTTVTHKLSIRDVTFSTEQWISGTSTVRKLFVGVESWGTSNTYTNTSSLFRECTSLRGIPSSWAGLGNVTSTGYMFYRCESLTSIPASWEGLGSLMDARGMFEDCSALTSIPARWAGLASLDGAGYMFQGCISLTSIPASWEGLGALSYAGGMFRDCISLTSIPASWEGLVALTNANEMFRDCTSLSNCGTIFTGLAMATKVGYLFNGCTGMRGDIHALYVYLSTKPVAVIYFSYCFGGCTQAVGYSSIPASWK